MNLSIKVMLVKFKTINGLVIDKDLPDNCSVLEAISLLSNNDLIVSHMIYSGSVLKQDDLFRDFYISGNVIIVTAIASATTPATGSTPSTTSTTSTSASAATTTASTATTETYYEKTYNGNEIKQATLKNGDIMFNIIQSIVKQKPYILTYLALKPEEAKKDIMQSLDDPEFKLTIRGPDETCDPIKTIMMHPSGNNGYEIDRRNVEFLIMNSGQQHDLEKAVEIYLFMDRDIQRTLQALMNPSDQPLVVDNTQS